MSEINEKSRSIDKDLLSVSEIREAISLAEESGFSVEELAAYDKYWDIVSTEKTLMSGYFKEGEQLGLVKGEQIGLVKGEQIGLVKGEQKGDFLATCRIAKKLYNSNMSLEKISEITQLSISEIQKMLVETEVV